MKTDEQITIQDGVVVGALRQSVNGSREAGAGSIHDDATASKLGFRGGTVAGSIHMELFPPLLVQAFGQRWFERGTLSMNFVNATTDREAVRAHVKLPPEGAQDAQVDVWVDREDGMRVGEGTASVGTPDATTFLQAKDKSRFSEGEFRILKGLSAGDTLGPMEVDLEGRRQAGRVKAGHITEVLDWYSGDSPWGGAVATPASMVQLLYQAPAGEIGRRTHGGKAVGLFGAIELRNINGPVLMDRVYTVSGTVLSVGQSPKTEYVWFETGADDENGTRVAEMIMQLRWMKASSPLYQDA